MLSLRIWRLSAGRRARVAAAAVSAAAAADSEVVWDSDVVAPDSPLPGLLAEAATAAGRAVAALAAAAFLEEHLVDLGVVMVEVAWSNNRLGAGGGVVKQ